MAEQEKVPCVVRSPTRDEMQQVVDMINAEGWNTHLEILLDIFDLQPNSSKVAVDENGLILCMYLPYLMQQQRSTLSKRIRSKNAFQ